ncbi:SDR family oxidoreductase [Tistrella mobilis]|uniref:SDR family oxidoreductase n=1 Tax=Tistrella mobilis TaxID=171437 RepID=UPI0035577F6E
MSRTDMQHLRVVIMGASSGIGQATAEAFARRGASLILSARDAAALNAVAARCRLAGGTAHVAPADVTDADAVAGVVAEARRRCGGIDLWVSNAGVGAVGRFHETPMAAHDQVIRTNLIGHMNDAHAVLPVFLEQGHGTFVNVVSLGAFAAAPFAAAYSASKFGLTGFSEALRAELADRPRIHVCDVHPGFVDTPGLAHGANYTGRRLKPMPPVLDARRVAAAIVDLARHPRPQVVIGLSAHAVRIGHALAPDLGARLMARITELYLRRAPRMHPTDGNLFAPPAAPGGIDGGFRHGRRRGARLAGAAALGLVCGGLALALRRRVRSI